MCLWARYATWLGSKLAPMEKVSLEKGCFSTSNRCSTATASRASGHPSREGYDRGPTDYRGHPALSRHGVSVFRPSSDATESRRSRLANGLLSQLSAPCDPSSLGIRVVALTRSTGVLLNSPSSRIALVTLY